MAIITLLTDFGLQDEYVGVLKGVIYTINPSATLVDLSHHIAPQDIVQAAYTMKAAVDYFPQGTIHVCIVDPGVGSARSIVAALYAGHTFIAPDNGLLSPIWGSDCPEKIVRVHNQQLFLKQVSHTFHGRDIFAPVAAHLSLGVKIEELGSSLPLSKLTKLSLPQPRLKSDREIIGQVVSVDRFGNLITNIDASMINKLKADRAPEMVAIRIGNHYIEGLSLTYGQTDTGATVAVVGSRNCLEVAVNGDSAADMLNAGRGTSVRVSVMPST